jgi:hypothetical protein
MRRREPTLARFRQRIGFQQFKHRAKVLTQRHEDAKEQNF